MITNATLVVILAPVLFLLVAIISRFEPGIDPRNLKKIGNIAGIGGILLSIGAGFSLALSGSTQTHTLGVNGLGLSVRLDPLSVTMLLMISILAFIIFRYSATYLQGDSKHGAFLGYLGITIASVEFLVVSGNLGLFAIAWICTSVSLHKLLLFYKDRPRAQSAARKKFIVARLGDIFLLLAFFILFQEFNTGDLATIFTEVQNVVSSNPGWTLTSIDYAALSLAMAAILKAAQFPTHGWLVEVMETPTPVSALLHAGILNAGPFLIIRMAHVVDGSRLAMTILILIGGFTAAFASVVLLTQPSVKVLLGYSSVAHMGFMLMVCGIGLYPAALLHLVAHSFYKAHAFLSSASAIDETRAHGVSLPKRLGSVPRVIASLLIAIAWYVPVAWMWNSVLGTSPATIAIGAIFVLGMTQLIAPAVDSNGPLNGSIRASLLALAVTSSFFLLEALTYKLLNSTIPEAINRDLVQLAAVAIILLIFGAIVITQIFGATHVQGSRKRALALHFRNGLYLNSYFDRLVGAYKIRDHKTTKLEAIQ